MGAGKFYNTPAGRVRTDQLCRSGVLYDRRSVEFRLLQVRYLHDLQARINSDQLNFSLLQNILTTSVCDPDPQKFNEALGSLGRQRERALRHLEFSDPETPEAKTQLSQAEREAQSLEYLRIVAGESNRFSSLQGIISKIENVALQTQDLLSETVAEHADT